MERKIGEIFENNGEWYQCVESDSCGECSLRITECRSGTKSDLADEIFGQCSKVRRSDNKHVIFKKLEKVGEPIIYMSRTFQRLKSSDAEQCKYCYFGNQVCNPQLCGEESFLVEIKQTKEDMEENKLSLKPFNLEAAKTGKPVCTRDGRKARIICFDAKRQKGEKVIIALIEQEDGSEYVESYNMDGKFSIDGAGNRYDLMMLPKKKTGWINIYPKSNITHIAETSEGVYPTEVVAKLYAQADCIATVPIEWEE